MPSKIPEMERLAKKKETKISVQVPEWMADELATMFAPRGYKSRAALIRNIIKEWIERNQ